MSVPRVVLRPRKARAFFARHPWVFPGSIAEIHGDPENGAEVDLVSHGGNFIARGLWNGHSKIRLRLYSWDPDTPLDRAFFHRQISQALFLRNSLLGLNLPGQASRLVFSEADGLSGLTVDRYDRWLVTQISSLGMAQRRGDMAQILGELVDCEGIFFRPDRALTDWEGMPLEEEVLWGQVPKDPIEIQEGPLRFSVNLREGQKTGLFLDQADNRPVVARLARGKRVLDAFCYSGGFALHAAQAGATEVVGLDVSSLAIQWANHNAQINGLTNVTFQRADVFEALTEHVARGEKYGLVVLDPPKFARSRQALDEALGGYRRLQTLGLRLLGPEGILVICCCTGLVTFAMLEELLAQLAESERRTIQILERRGPSPDHPVSVTCPESNYLKCLICRVC